ncbi:MAG: MFS transporter [Chromatiales bacterium]|jgi:PPP family 3-phenylpropionic acid transporter|nr:MFS transporter [Chromatiales bacterium]
MYLRHSIFYFFYFAALGVLVPYWAVYLQGRGFSAVEIGELIAITMATKVVAPVLWGWAADLRGQRLMVVRSAVLLATIVFAGVFLGDGYWWLVLVMAVFSFFWNAALPQFEAITMSRLGSEVHRYSSIRLWGSVGFVVTAAGFGLVLDHYGASQVPIALFMLFAAVCLSVLFVSVDSKAMLASKSAAEEERQSLWSLLKRRRIAALLAVCFLMQLSHGPYYSFFSIHLDNHGYPRWLVGQLWALGVVAEIVAFLVMRRLYQRFSARDLLLASLALTSLRWVLIALFTTRLSVIVFAQLLHAASFGVYHAIVIALIHESFQGRHQGRGQALYSSISFGAGGAIGSLYAGYLWDSAGATPTFLFAALASAAAFVIALRSEVGVAERRSAGASGAQERLFDDRQ